MSRPAAMRSRRHAPFGEPGKSGCGARAGGAMRPPTGERMLDPGATPTTFVCANCGATITGTAPGTGHCNHCPHCLWSLHVDVRPGDRAHLCRAPMEPIALWSPSHGDLRIIHRCTRCGELKANRVAGDDSDRMLRRLCGDEGTPAEPKLGRVARAVQRLELTIPSLAILFRNVLGFSAKTSAAPPGP